MLKAAEVATLTESQLETLRHMLGINDPWTRVPTPYRDYYCANRDDPKLGELERLGAVRLYRKSDTYDWYCTTDAGRTAAMASHKTIRKGKSARVYSAYLSVSDCFAELTFKEFLTNPQFRETRQNA